VAIHGRNIPFAVSTRGVFKLLKGTFFFLERKAMSKKVDG
jgi:hypothetical protein